jgi:hypothetical protein
VKVRHKEVQAVQTITTSSTFVQATQKMFDKFTQFDFKIIQHGEERVHRNDDKCNAFTGGLE